MAFTAALRDLNKLNTFVRVAQHRSFTKAAAELRTRPSVVSKRIKELEESLGFSLVNRSTHGLGLTDAGEGIFQRCLEQLANMDDYITERRKSRLAPLAHCGLKPGMTTHASFWRLSPSSSRRNAPASAFTFLLFLTTPFQWKTDLTSLSAGKSHPSRALLVVTSAQSR